MKVCRNCGRDIPNDDQKFCPNCGTPVTATPAYYETQNTPEEDTYIDCPYPMAWHEFFSNIGIFILAAIYVFMAFKFFNGTILGFLLNIEGLKIKSGIGIVKELEMLVTFTNIFGVIMLAGAVDCVLTRNMLINFDYRAKKRVLSVISHGITVPLIYFLIIFFMLVSKVDNSSIDYIMRWFFSELELICPVTLYFAGFIVLSGFNSTYYTRRRSLFD